MKLLQVIATLDPAYGGPVEALRQMTMALNELGHTSETVTLDAPDEKWVAEFPGVVCALGPSRLKYRYNVNLIPWLAEHAGEYDAVISCGIWQYQSYGVWQAAKRYEFPYFVFVHGALDPWFKRAYPLKHLKKWLYWPWAEYRVLRDARAALFCSQEERLLARQSFWLYRVNEAMVDNGISFPQGDKAAQRERFLESYPFLRNKRLLLFMSRIHQKKGCDLLIHAFARVASQDPQLHLVMAGPDQSGWQRELIALSQRFGIADRIAWTGMLAGDLKWGAFHAAEVFVLPSHQENFGMVIVEALACGIPVLISKKVNIWREIDQSKAGLIAEDNIEGATNLLSHWLSLSPAEKKQMSKAALECFYARFEIHSAARSLIDVVSKYVTLSN